MSIIVVEINTSLLNFEKGLKGLEVFRDPETKHIMFTREGAKGELLKFLLSEYRAEVGRHNPIVEALAQIVGEKEGKWFDFTEVYEKFVDKAQRESEAEEERKYGKGRSNIMDPKPKP